ncbi:MAG: hypothetical protein AB9Q17_12785 [Candidatus Reddybacter sp.]
MTTFKALPVGMLLAIVSSGSLALNLNSQQESKSLVFADSALECGIYYEYTAGGLEKNPNVDSEVVRAIALNSETLLRTAGLLYDAAGISIADRRKKLMHRARIMIKERQESPGRIDELIYEFGEKCKLLMTTYSYRIKNIAAEPNSI